MIVDLGDTTRGIPLCGHHTRTRTAPVGWTLVDERTGPIQPSLWNPAAPPPAQQGPADRPAVRRSPEATFHWDEHITDPEPVTAAEPVATDPDSADADRAEAARDEAVNDEAKKPSSATPLLARAFRNA